MAKRIAVCKGCLANELEVGPISRRGWCEDCGVAVAVTAAVSMKDRRGPAWDAYVSSMLTVIHNAAPPGGC